MSHSTDKYGRQTGKSSDRWLSPQKPYTGDGKTKRKITDGVKLIFKKGKKPTQW